jgi:uncharacterized protein with NRDE domain
MCTLIVLNDIVPGYPLVVAGNRDERFGRRTGRPTLVDGIARPWDLDADGTWFAINRDGFFAALTNVVEDDWSSPPGERSRGKLITDVLSIGTVYGVQNYCASLGAKEFGKFELIYGMPCRMERFIMSDNRYKEELHPGTHVITNRRFDPDSQKAWDTQWRAAGAVSESDGIDPIVDRLYELLASHGHDLGTRHSVCAHEPDGGSGTLSSSIVTVSNRGRIEYWYSEGHPCNSEGLQLALAFETR